MRIRRPRPAPIPRSAFADFRFPPEVIVVAVRWYLRFGLSYRDAEELLVERGVEVDHVSVYRWVRTSSHRMRRIVPARAAWLVHLSQAETTSSMPGRTLVRGA